MKQIRDNFSTEIRKNTMKKRLAEKRKRIMQELDRGFAPNTPIDRLAPVNDNMLLTLVQSKKQIETAFSVHDYAQVKQEIVDVRKLISQDIDNVPVMECAKSEIIHTLLYCLSPELQNEPAIVKNALWCFVNITSKSDEAFLVGLETNQFLKKIADLLNINNKSWQELISIIISNFLGESLQFRDKIIQLSIPAKYILTKDEWLNDYKIAEAATFMLCNIMRGPPYLDYDSSTQILKLIFEANQVFDAKSLIIELAWALSYFLGPNDESNTKRMWTIINYSFIHEIFQKLMLSNELQIVRPAIRCVGLLSGGDPDMVNKFFTKQVIHVSFIFPKCLEYFISSQKVKEQICDCRDLLVPH